MKEANQQLQHNISVSHQMINSECRILERRLRSGSLTNEDVFASIELLKEAVEVSKKCLKEHYEKTGVPINAT